MANCAFARSVDPHNAALQARSAQAAQLRAHGAPTLPSTLDDERACNPFLRVDSAALVDALGGTDRVARFADLRRRKDDYRAVAA